MDPQGYSSPPLFRKAENPASYPKCEFQSVHAPQAWQLKAAAQPEVMYMICKWTLPVVSDLTPLIPCGSKGPKVMLQSPQSHSGYSIWGVRNVGPSGVVLKYRRLDVSKVSSAGKPLFHVRRKPRTRGLQPAVPKVIR